MSTTHPAPVGTSDARIYGLYFREQHNKDRPEGCPDLVDNTVIARVWEGVHQCPVCYRDFDDYTHRNRRCTQCFTYFLLPGDSGPYDILNTRLATYGGKAYIPGLEYLIGEESLLPVVLWTPATEEVLHRPVESH